MKLPLLFQIKFCRVILLFAIIFSSPIAYGTEGEFFELKVVKGDKLINICQKYLEDSQKWREVAAVNKLKNPNLIYPGQTLLIPVQLLKGTPLEARVSFLKGEVIIQEKGKEEWIGLKLNELVKQGSTIKTADRSAVEVTFVEDGASFFLRANTTLGLTTAQKKGGFYTARKLFLQKGNTILRSIPPSGARSRSEIVTQNAVAGVRGTDFRAAVDQEETTRMEVLRGAIELMAQKQKVEVREGEGSIVKKGAPPLKPRKLLLPPAPLDLEPIYKSMPISIKFTSIEGATFYRIMLAKDKEMKDLVYEKVIRPDEKFLLVGIDDGLYFLQSHSIDDLGIEGIPLPPVELKIRINPLPPYIEAPARGAEFKKKSVTFKWLKVTDAVNYRLQVATESAFKTLIIDKKDITDTEFTLENLEFKRYWFRLKSIAADGYEGLWSDALSFIILPPPPAPPLQKPELGKEEITIRWQDLGKGIHYQFQMAKDRDFQQILHTQKVEKPEITLPKPQEFGTYYVRTKAIDADGYAGDFSMPQSFEIKPPPPPRPIINKPEIRWKEVYVSWNDLGKGMRYYFQLSEDAEFQKLLLEKELAKPAIILPKPLEFGEYYVRVKAIDAEGRVGDYSSSQSFKLTHGIPYIPIGVLILLGLILLGL